MDNTTYQARLDDLAKREADIARREAELAETKKKCAEIISAELARVIGEMADNNRQAQVEHNARVLNDRKMTPIERRNKNQQRVRTDYTW